MNAICTLAAAALVLLVTAPAVAGESPPGGGGFAGDEACVACHQEAAIGGEVERHLRARPFEVLGRRVGCEGCHGPGQAHAEAADPTLIRSFEANEAADRACLDCHATAHPEWPSSVHAAEGVSCLSCHSIHRPRSPQTACRDCHAEQVAQFQLPSHHPLREGKMSCASCHDVHGATEAMLRTRQRPNDLCYTCHQAVEGPFVFEHPPVQEDCGICHAPHGAVADHLLVANEPMLCLQCHDFHFHAGYETPDGPVEVGGTERENRFGARSFNVAFTTSCTQCHARIHGSDLPSQTVPGRGRGLTQ